VAKKVLAKYPEYQDMINAPDPKNIFQKTA
jgi:hypothetical protein